MKNEQAYIEQLVREKFEKHGLEDTALQNALIEILEQTTPSSTSESSSADVLSEKLRDEPRDK